ncbi:unnamed protein product [Dovyalis caffra]|uniref:Uncharacterized protein n=1 Tax=Dovyalis caffra TaxID=77055 RepID=A0AAV1SIE5_9ROSI|nr:unnamed protein product [Dovyalis caffra]
MLRGEVQIRLSLEVLKIKISNLTVGAIQDLISNFSAFKVLILDLDKVWDLDGNELESIKISNQRLEKLKLFSYTMETIIDAPRLKSLKYLLRKFPSVFSVNTTSLHEVDLPNPPSILVSQHDVNGDVVQCFVGRKMENVLDQEINVINDIVGPEEHVICALSGARIPQLLYKERERVMETFESDLHLPVTCVDASNEFLIKLKGRSGILNIYKFQVHTCSLPSSGLAVSESHRPKIALIVNRNMSKASADLLFFRTPSWLATRSGRCLH